MREPLISRDVTPETQDHFSWLASSWAGLYERRESFRSRLHMMNNVLLDVLREDDIVLDFGSGAGVLSALASQSAEKVISVDGNAAMLKAAATNEELLTRVLRQVNARYFPHRVSRVVGTRNCLSSKSQVDVVLAIAVLEYVHDIAAHLESLVSLLRPGGHLIITYPNAESIVRRVEGPVDRVATGAGRVARIRRLKSREYSGLRPARVADLAPLIAKVGLEVQMRRGVPLGSGWLRKRLAPNHVWVARRPS